MSIVVFYVEQEDVFNDGTLIENVPVIEEFGKNQLTVALKRCQELRQLGKRHVTMSCENEDSVGKPGVDAIVDGKTPAGEAYDWKKDRAGRMRAADYTKIHRNDN